MNIISRDGSQIVSVSEAKANSRVTIDAEDSLFQSWVDIAHDTVEENTNLVLQQSTCEQVFDGKEINLHAPVRGIVSVKTYDSDNVETITTDYTWKKTSKYGLCLTLNTAPTNYAVIRFVAGFGEYTATGSEIAINEGTINAYNQAKSSILLITNHLYENRGIVSDFKKHALEFSVNLMMDNITKHL